jgi:hypothetical protein
MSQKMLLLKCLKFQSIQNSLSRVISLQFCFFPHALYFVNRHLVKQLLALLVTFVVIISK